MKRISSSELKQVSGAGWDSFWESVGDTIGSWVAGAAYSKESKRLHDIGSGNSEITLNQFLSSQNDPLL
ncbi:hypothetical protein [Agaribacter flavus]|uniref:Bacteriocin n=1 Tax=Agaribacter flavus TaxID=1902781 RepID=A0ABV7FVV2_9ALTE